MQLGQIFLDLVRLSVPGAGVEPRWSLAAESVDQPALYNQLAILRVPVPVAGGPFPQQ